MRRVNLYIFERQIACIFAISLLLLFSPSFVVVVGGGGGVLCVVVVVVVVCCVLPHYSVVLQAKSLDSNPLPTITTLVWAYDRANLRERIDQYQHRYSRNTNTHTYIHTYIHTRARVIIFFHCISGCALCTDLFVCVVSDTMILFCCCCYIVFICLCVFVCVGGWGSLRDWVEWERCGYAVSLPIQLHQSW